MKRLTKLEKFGLIAAIIIAGTYFYMGKVYDPQAKALKKTVNKLNKIIKEINSFKTVPRIKPIHKKIEKRKKELEKVKTVLENTAKKTGKESEVTEILSRINSLADKNRLVVNSIAPKGKVDGTFFTWSSFDLDVEGSYYLFLDFLSDLKEMPEPVKIQNILIEKKREPPGLLKINMTIMI